MFERMKGDKKMKTAEALKNIEEEIARMEQYPSRYMHTVRIDKVYDKLGIFDWWHERLSLSQLKQMRSFCKTAIKYGYTGYVCFKVGAAGCSHGMWANKKESTNGYSPDGAELHHSFRSGDNYWCVKDDNEQWLKNESGEEYFTTKELKELLAK